MYCACVHLKCSLFSSGGGPYPGTVQKEGIVSRQAHRIYSNICDLAAVLCLIFGCQALELRQTRPASENTKDRVERAFMEQIAGARHSQRMLSVVFGDGLKEGDNIRLSRYTGGASQLVRTRTHTHLHWLTTHARARACKNTSLSFSLVLTCISKRICTPVRALTSTHCPLNTRTEQKYARARTMNRNSEAPSCDTLL